MSFSSVSALPLGSSISISGSSFTYNGDPAFSGAITGSNQIQLAYKTVISTVQGIQPGTYIFFLDVVVNNNNLAGLALMNGVTRLPPVVHHIELNNNNGNVITCRTANMNDVVFCVNGGLENNNTSNQSVLLATNMNNPFASGGATVNNTYKDTLVGMYSFTAPTNTVNIVFSGSGTTSFTGTTQLKWLRIL